MPNLTPRERADGILVAPWPTEPFIDFGIRCTRCGAVRRERAAVSGGKCPLFKGDRTHSPHDWEAVRLETRVLPK